MGIRRTIGLVLFLIVVKILMPDVFDGIEATLVMFFVVLKKLLLTAGTLQHNTAQVVPQELVPRMPF